MKRSRPHHTPPRRGGVARSAGVVSSTKASTSLTTPSATSEASPDRARAPRGASTPPLRGGEYREMERLKAELERVQQQQQQQLQHDQQSLREALRRFEELYNFAPVSLISLDRRGMILDLNEGAARLLAFPMEWLRDRPFLVFVAKHEVSRFLEFLAFLRR